MMDKSVLNVIRAISKNRFVLAVVLFGSQASGKARPYSDVDLCVVSEKPLSHKDRETLLGLGSKNIDIRPFWDLPAALRFEVLKNGRLLHLNNEAAFQRVAVRSLREYWDLLPLLNRFLGA